MASSSIGLAVQRQPGVVMTSLKPVTLEALSRLVLASKPTTCLFDPMPTNFKERWPTLGLLC